MRGWSYKLVGGGKLASKKRWDWKEVDCQNWRQVGGWPPKHVGLKMVATDLWLGWDNAASQWTYLLWFSVYMFPF